MRRTRDVEQILRAGADSRAVPGGKNRFTKYGCLFRPRDVLALGSCTASSPSRRAFGAASKTADRIYADENLVERERALAEHFVGVRQRLKNVFIRDERHDTIDVVLAPSGTDVEYMPCALVLGCVEGEITNIVVAPGEVGSGTAFAAEGLYFDPVTPAGERQRGDALCEDLSAAIERVDVQVRETTGKERPMTDIDAEVVRVAEDAIARGRHVLVHRVAHTKTGIFAPSIDALQALKSRFPDRVNVVVDAAQSRISRDRITAALDRGSMLFVTGSKFYGGPPFSAALFVPKHMRPEQPLRQELGEFFSQHLFPESWRPMLGNLPRRLDRGLALRWEAALTEIETFWSLKPAVRHRILSAFERYMRQSLESLDEAELRGVAPAHICSGETEHKLEGHQTVFPFEIRTEGRYWDKAELNALHHYLNTNGDVAVHLGQPVALGASGARYALRAALGAPLVNDLATRAELGETLDERLDWLRAELDKLPGKIRDYINEKVERSA